MRQTALLCACNWFIQISIHLHISLIDLLFYSPWDFFTHRSEEFVCTYYNVRCPRSFFLIKWRWILAFIELFEKITHFTFYQRTALPNQYCHPRVQLKCTLIKLGLNLKSQFQSNRIQFLICRDNVIWFRKPRIIYLTRKLHYTYVHVSWLLGDNTTGCDIAPCLRHRTI